MKPFIKLYQKWKSSLFYGAFKKILHNPKTALYIVLFDVLFFVTVYYVNLLSRTIIPSDLTKISGTVAYSIPFVLLLYLLALLIIYSLFKYIVLDFLYNLVDPKNKPGRFIFGKRFFLFCLLNLSIFVTFFFFLTISNAIIRSFISDKYIGIALLIGLLILVGVTYLVLNISHTLFIKNLNFKEILSKTFSGEIFKRSLFVILSSLIFLIFYLLIFYIIALIINKAEIDIKSARVILGVLTNLAYYLIHFYNRVYVYLIINKKIHL